MSDCIFCKIIAGEIPSVKVYEDDFILAFLDITQVTEGHTLVIPKKHSRNLLEMTASEASELFSRIPKIANLIKNNLGATGMNIVNNNEAIAYQSVFHTHVHLLPRYDETDEFKMSFADRSAEYPIEKLKAVADRINGK
ncbi:MULTISPECIES: HIT family protein [unclassified Enterococcus]|uniref:HIT family protein n=1 Tax=unclassified Enterococcus TaxID=2608891 RepID=UPI001558314B|nr:MULTISPECIES: HIT family protein [unclassified Enterococcus]MBS7576519.1 HIT family protein [Enterococcus sp. MMGLQ5-2]MBS7583994.1 HIT family protein [Enterococcus sp. MMGLQ5-1]NPD11855.1 HIT family protein [Enterococcus sp. MMGLQ5-1]NPD36356.1 HIT family protein [Enterococcus sp. MMGLQ5-2]